MVFFLFFGGGGGGGGHVKTLALKWKGQEKCKGKELGGGSLGGGSTSKLCFAKWRKTLLTT